MRNSTQAHLRFLTQAAVHKVLKDRTEVLVLKVRWTFVSTDRSGTKNGLKHLRMKHFLYTLFQ